MMTETTSNGLHPRAMPGRAFYLAAAASAAIHAAGIAVLLSSDVPSLSALGGTAAQLEVAFQRPPAGSAGDRPGTEQPRETDDATNTSRTINAPEPLPPSARPPASPRREARNARVVVSEDSRAPGIQAEETETRIQPPSATATPPGALPVAMRASEIRMLEERMQEWRERLPELTERDEPVTWEHEGRSWQARFDARPATDASELDRARVEIRTRRNDRTLSTNMQFKRLAFSHYAQFINYWDDNVVLSSDRVDGRFHANSAIAVDPGAEPRFNGPVTIAANQPRSHSMRRSGQFPGGLTTRAQRIAMPREAMPFAESETPDDESIHRFTQDSRIVFHGNGEYHWQAESSGSIAGRRSTGGNSVYLMAEGDVTLTVSGTVDGRVLVYSPRRIIIAGDLRYARDPQDSADSDDFLSLISDHTIQIAPPSVTGPGDLTVQAALFAGRRFSVRRFRTPEQAVLRVYGSLTAGSMSATEPRYASHVQFDPRLEQQRAPGIPMTGRFELESWQRRWRAQR